MREGGREESALLSPRGRKVSRGGGCGGRCTHLAFPSRGRPCGAREGLQAVGAHSSLARRERRAGAPGASSFKRALDCAGRAGEGEEGVRGVAQQQNRRGGVEIKFEGAC